MKTPKQSSLQYKLKNDDILYFLHIPKTAGTTFATVLENYFDLDSICPEQLWHELLPEKKLNFLKYKLIWGHYGYCLYQILPKKPVYITILRDPIEQTISSIEHRIHDPDPRFIHLNEFIGKTLHEILEDSKIKLSPDPQTSYIGLDPDVASMIDLFNRESILNFNFAETLKLIKSKTTHEDLIKTSIQNLSKFAFVGIAEKFEESMFLLFYTFGWRPMARLWKLNVTLSRTKTSSLPPKAIQKILDATQLDKKLYEYGLKLFEERYSKMVEELEVKYFEPSFANLSLREKMYKMLEKHYESCLQESRMKPAKSIDYDFRQKLSGNGWYWVEFIEKNGNAFRWTGPETTSTIDFTLNTNHDLIIQFRVIREIVPGLLKSLKLKVNDHPIEIKKIEEKSGNTVFEGFIPKFVLMNKKHFTRLCFEIDRTINPHEVNSSDPTDRPLGIAVDKIKILPSKEYAVDKIKILPSKEYAVDKIKIMPSKEYDETRDEIEISPMSLFSKKNLQGNADVARLRRRTNKWNRYWRKKGLLFL